MANQPYYPVTEAAQIQWLNNYKLKIPTYGASVGILSVELASTNYDLLFYVWILETWNPAIQNDAQAATAYKKLIGQSPATGVPSTPIPPASTFASPPTVTTPGVLKRLFNQIVRIKASPAYTPAMGQDLQIIGQADSAVHLTPDFTAKVEDAVGGQQVRIKFTKYGHDGVYIQSSRNGGAWNFLAIDTVSPYLDNAPLLVANTPETREYRMSFWDKGAPDGDWTAVQKVTAGA